MKKVYRVSKVALVLGFERLDVDEKGGEEVKTNQTITYDKLMTEAQILEVMKAKIEPGEVIECSIKPEVVQK